MGMSGLNTALALLFLYCFLHPLNVFSIDNSVVNPPSEWINNSTLKGSLSFSNGSFIRPILLVQSVGSTGFGFGFFSEGSNGFFILALIYLPNPSNYSEYTPQIIWAANRDQPVSSNSRLELTAQGDLVLRDYDDTFIWSTNTSGLNVTSMKLTSYGNLQLRNGSDLGVVWHSFDHPTNTWLWSQTLRMGQRLIASVSTTNYSTGQYYLSVNHDGIYAYLDSNPPKMYSTVLLFSNSSNSSDFVVWNDSGAPTEVTYTPDSAEYVRLEPDGNLRVARLFDLVEPNVTSNRSIDDHLFGDCANATVCGNYGVCSGGQCSCPAEIGGNMSYFRQVNAEQPNLGCFAVNPLSCKHTQLHTFLPLENVTYFDFVPLFSNTDMESCKTACLGNCSCKAALFRYQNNVSSGNCSLPVQLFSLIATRREVVGFNSYAFIKVQRSKGTGSQILIILLSSLSAFIVFLIGGACYYYHATRKKSSKEAEREEEEDDESLDNMPSMLMRFSFEELRSVMQRGGGKLGRGGFGSVYEGILENGTRVAVKVLESVHQGRREFVAELNTIGSIHHVNLVRLIGYCTEGSNRLLVYEHMCNGSLDKWIFDESRAQTLSWEVREKIIVGIANGLEYLHQHCHRHIIHFDIKPQNILLDEKFNVKISDFGLAKLIDRNESQVFTRLKGTPGYAAPELIRGMYVSVKADIYSFGIVILEVVCGRKNLGKNDCLIDMVKIKAEKDRFSDLVDDRNEDMQFHQGEAVKMIQIAIRCLQPHFKRPSVSMVIKVLEGLMDMEPISDYSFLTMVHMGNPSEASQVVSAPPMPSILSGPR